MNANVVKFPKKKKKPGKAGLGLKPPSNVVEFPRERWPSLTRRLAMEFSPF